MLISSQAGLRLLSAPLSLSLSTCLPACLLAASHRAPLYPPIPYHPTAFCMQVRPGEASMADQPGCLSAVAVVRWLLAAVCSPRGMACRYPPKGHTVQRHCMRSDRNVTITGRQVDRQAGKQHPTNHLPGTNTDQVVDVGNSMRPVWRALLPTCQSGVLRKRKQICRPRTQREWTVCNQSCLALGKSQRRAALHFIFSPSVETHV